MRLFVSCIPFDGGRSGISVYTRQVVSALRSEGHDLTLLLEPDVPEGSFGGDGADFRIVRAPRWTRRPALSMLWHLFVLPWVVRRRRAEFDAMFIAAANRRVCAWYPLPTVATVHDLANFHVPGKYSRARMFYLAYVLPFFAKRAHRLVAVSESTKADMVRFWHCRPESITVLYEGLPPSVAALSSRSSSSSLSSLSSSAAASAARSILYISRIEHPGKNHVRLIEAYSRLPREVAEAHPLVCVGADWHGAEAVHAAAAASPYADLIRFTGFVSDLEPLWQSASLYVFPSLFEGFGLSLIEAMARGIPCACSNNGSLGEIGEGVAEAFDPGSVDAMAGALLRLVSEEPDARRERIGRGLALVQKFSWPDHARGIVRLLEEAGNCSESA